MIRCWLSLTTKKKSQTVNYSEFIAMTMDKKDYMQENYVWEVFRHFDVKNTGTITKDDLAVVLTGGTRTDFESALELEKAEIEETIKLVDQNDDGEIDFDEFMALTKRSEGRQSRASRASTKTSQDSKPEGTFSRLKKM